MASLTEWLHKSKPELFLLKLILGNTYPIHNHDLDITISLPTFYLSFLIGRVPEVESRKLTPAASSVLIRRTEVPSLSAPLGAGGWETFL